MRKPVLMPEPNNIRFFAGYGRLTNDYPVFISMEAGVISPDILDVINKKMELNLKKVENSKKAEKAENYGLFVKLLDEKELWQIEQKFGTSLQIRDLKAESHFIGIDSGQIVLAARDPKGFFNGVQTLKQLVVARDTANEGLTVKNCVIFDYPHVKIRGIHLYLPARENFQFFKNLIEGLAELKYNTVYLETSAMEYKRHPELNEAWLAYSKDMDEFPEKAKIYQSGFHNKERPWYLNSIHIENAGGGILLQDEVRELVRYCKDNLIDVVPEVQSLSHCSYLTVAHREIAENPEDPYPDTYCPSNPKSYELLFDVIDEVIEVFEPNSISIGHDEWYSVAMCPNCKGKDAAELLAWDVTKIHDYLSVKGIRTEMFGDKLLNAHTPDGRGQGGAFRIVEDYYTSEVYNTIQPTYRAADKIPKDILIQHWYWGIEPEGYKYFQQKGLNIIYNNFDSFGMQLRDWETLSREPNVLGGSLSHWDLVEENNMAWDGVLTDAVCSSYSLWNESYSNFSWGKTRDMTLAYMPYFMQQLRGRNLPSLSCKPKEYLSVFVRHENKEKFYMSSSVVELRNFMQKDIRQKYKDAYYRGISVEVIEKGQEFRTAIVNDRADSLVFRHNTDISLPYVSSDHGIRFENYLIGHYTVEYADGTEITINLHYGRNIGNLAVKWGVDRDSSDIYNIKDIRLLQAAYYTKPWIKTLNDNEQATVFDYEWINPRPDSEIRGITLTMHNMKVPFSIFIYDIYGIRLGDAI